MSIKRKNEDTEFEIRFYEGILRKKPDFIGVLSALGDLYTRGGQVKKGLEIDQKLASLRPEDPVVLYNLACSYSLLDHVDLALKFIKKAVNYGYDDFTFMEQDTDLANLHNDLRFKRYFKRVKQRSIQPQK